MARKKRKAKTLATETPAEPLSRPPRNEESRAEQSGDLQGLSDIPDGGSESVRELTAEGQFFEAEIISGVENAPDPEAGPIKPHRRKEDDLPPEYTDQPPDEPKE